jgi:hypothetical protein
LQFIGNLLLVQKGKGKEGGEVIEITGKIIEIIKLKGEKL